MWFSLSCFNPTGGNQYHDCICPELLTNTTDIPELDKLKVSPNPASHFAKIHSDKELQTILAFNNHGKSFQLNPTGDLIDVNELPDGIYTLLVVYADGSAKRSRLVVAH